MDCSHTLALSRRENGNKRKRMASGLTPSLLSVSTNCKKTEMCKFGSSVGFSGERVMSYYLQQRGFQFEIVSCNCTMNNARIVVLIKGHNKLLKGPIIIIIAHSKQQSASSSKVTLNFVYVSSAITSTTSSSSAKIEKTEKCLSLDDVTV